MARHYRHRGSLGTLILSALEAPSHTREALFGVGAVALLLLFIGIHIAWDNVAYHALVNNSGAKD